MAWSPVTGGTQASSRVLPDETWAVVDVAGMGPDWVYSVTSRTDFMYVISRTSWVNNADIASGNGDITLVKAPEVFAIKPSWRRATRRFPGVYTPPADPFWSDVQLLLSGEGVDQGSTITDSSSFARTPASNSGTVTSTTQFKYGASSLYFDAVSTLTQRGLTYSIDSSSTFGTGDYTIELFFRLAATGRTNFLFCIGTFSGFLLVDASGNIRWLNQVFTPASAVAVDTWYHLAVVRESGTVKIFLDGTQVGSDYSSSRNHTTTTWWVGRDFDTDSGLYGYIDELRVTKGAARYTAPFTPPTGAFPVP